MKKNSFKIMMFLFIGLSLAITLSSCNKSVDGSVVDASTRRSFTPYNLKVNTVKDSALFSFIAPLYATSGMTYTIELAKDSAFSSIDYSLITDTTLAVATDSILALNTPYYARVKVNPYNVFAASNYFIGEGTFKLIGLQYIKVIRDFEITSTSVLLHWYLNDYTQKATSLVLTPSKGGNPISSSVTADELNSGSKEIAGLTAGTKYTAQLFAGKKSVGLITFSTAPTVKYTTILNPDIDDLSAAIATATDGDVIGLNPGTYTLSSITNVLQKTITIRSVSNDPTDTKILSKEIDVVGDGAGITLVGIDFNANYGGTSNGTTFLQLLGSVTTIGVPATFTNVKIDNCIIHDYSRCVIRGNVGTVANNFKIGTISINNSQIYNIDLANNAGYYTCSLEKLQFNEVLFSKSTFYSMGEGLINMSTALAVPNVKPQISIDLCTMNNIGGNAKYLLFDANTNPVNYSLTNSILANTPMSGTLKTAAFRASATGNKMIFYLNNYFKFASSVGGFELVLTGLDQSLNIIEDLGWTSSTTNFSLNSIPYSNPIFSTSSSGSTIGDPRWAY